MKLLYDCTELSYYNEYSGHRAGVFNVALNLFKEFKKKGIDICFYCDYRRYYYMRDIEEFKDIPILVEHSNMNRFIGFILYISRFLPQHFKYALQVLSRYYDAYRGVNKRNLKELDNFDVYFSPFSAPSKEIELSNIKRFRMIHDIIPVLEDGMPTNPRKWYYKIYNSINNNDFYVTNSECTRHDVLKYFPFIKQDNIKTTLLGVNENFTPPLNPLPQGAGKSEKYVLSLCTLGKRKNLVFTIRNFFEFINRNNIKDLKLVLAGGVWKKFEHELEKELGQIDKSKIILTGYVKDEDLPLLYSNALMFIYPSLYEGFGLPVLEAMKCGCPVITSNTSSLPEVIGDAGIKINPENDEDLIEAFRKMYYDTFFRELCIERGQIRAKNFSWHKCASEILEYISEKTAEG